MDFANGEILIQCLRLIGSDPSLGGSLSLPKDRDLCRFCRPRLADPKP